MKALSLFLWLLLGLLMAWPSQADMYQDGSNAKLPEARDNLGIVATRTPALDCGAVPYAKDPTANAATAINTCVTRSIAEGWELTIDQDYRCASRCVLFQTNARIVFVNGARLIQGFASGTGGVVGQTVSSVSNVHIRGDMHIYGDPTYVMGGNLVNFDCDDCVIEGITGNYYGGTGSGRAVAFSGSRTILRNVRCYNPNPMGGAGGVRYHAGNDSRAHVSWCDSGDDTCQVVPGSTFNDPNMAKSTVNNFVYEGCGGISQIARLLIVGIGHRDHEPGSGVMGGSIRGVTFIAPTGYVHTGTGILINQDNSTGVMDDIRIIGLSMDNDAATNTPAISIISGGNSARMGSIFLDGVTVKSPYKTCLETSGEIERLVVNGLTCHRPHAGRLDPLTTPAALGATTLAVTPATCALTKSGHQLGLPLNTSDANGSNSDRMQFFTATSDCAANTVNISAPLLGTAGAGLGVTANLWNYSISPQRTTQAVSSGNTVYLQSPNEYEVGHTVMLVYDDNTTLTTTVTAITEILPHRTNSFTVAAPITKPISLGNWIANMSVGSTSNALDIRGVQSGSISDMLVYGGGSDPVVLGIAPGKESMVQDFALIRPRIRDIAPGKTGININACHHCLIEGGEVFPTAGNTTAKAVYQRAVVPAYTTTLAADMTNVQTTLSLTDGTQFPYKHAFVIKINDESMLATAGYGTNTLTVYRGLFGSVAAAHTSGAAITVNQSHTTDSPVSRLDVSALGSSQTGTGNDCTAITYAPGQGNWLRDIAGCDTNRDNYVSPTNLTYNDIGRRMVLTGGTATIGTIAMPTPPPRYDHDFYIINGSSQTMYLSSTDLNIPSGCGTSLGLRASLAIPFRFSSALQKLYPLSCGSGIDGTRRIFTGLGPDVATLADYAIDWDSPTVGAKAQTIPGCTTLLAGKQMVIADAENNAATNNIVITPSSGTINFAATHTINTNGASAWLRCNGAGANWIVK